MENDSGATIRTVRRRFIRLPKHPVLQPRRLVPGHEGRAEREPRPHVRHIRVVPHEQAILVAFAEPRRRETSINAHVAINCVFLVLVLFFPSALMDR